MAVYADPGLDLFGIGDRLREARVRRGLDLADAERATCIRAANLAAIEEERFDDLAADVYTAGFVRAYADFLDLDGDALAQYFRETRLHEQPELVHDWIDEPPPHARRRLAALVVVLVAAGCAAGVTVLRPHDAATLPAAAAPPVPVVHAHAPLVVRATGGPVWVSVHFDRAHGRRVWQGTLRQGRQLRFGLDRPLWVGLGSPGRATVTAAGESVASRRAQLVRSP